MARDDESLDDTGVDDATDDASVTSTSVNPDAPAFVKDIKPRTSGRASRLADIPLDMDVPYTFNNPYEMDGNSLSYKANTDIQGEQPNSGFYATAKAEAYNWNTTAQALHAGYEKFEEPNPSDDIAPPDWNPKTNQENFLNVRDENLPYILAATGPKDQAYRLQRVYSQQANDDILANGSFIAKLVGGALGIISDPSSYIPIVGWAKYAKLAPTFLRGAARAFPGIAAYSTVAAGAENVDKVNGNMQDFLTESFTNTVFGTVLFGIGGVAAVTADKMELWNLRKVASNYVDGIDYKLATNEKGVITGYKAVDIGEAQNAKKLSFAQDLADSSFAKSGIFKIPYVGEAVSKTLALKIPGTDFYFGSQLQSLLSSPYKTVRGFIDRVADHSLKTLGIEKGNAAPVKFATLMQQTMGRVRMLAVQVDALHLERNGFDIKNRPLGGLVNLGLNLKNKGMKVLAKDMDKSDYIDKDTFYSEIQDVLLNENKSNHAPVNDAANMLRTHMDEIYSNYRKAYNLPEDWLPPKTAQAYLTRVYDTAYMNGNKNAWTGTISNWLRDADGTITQRMQPINDLKQSIKDFEEKHTQAVHILANLDKGKIGKASTGNQKAIDHGTTMTVGEPNLPVPSAASTFELKHGTPEHTLHSMRQKLRALKDDLQNELRSNPDLQLHVHDWNALSANEAKELTGILKPLNNLKTKVAKQKIALSDAKKLAGQKLSSAKNTPKIKNAIPKAKEYVDVKNKVLPEEEKLRELQDQLDSEADRLQIAAHKGEINPRYVKKIPDSFNYEFKDPNDRLKFRDTYEDHAARETHANAYYDTIMNQTPEDTINQVMGKVTGHNTENPVKARTLLLPDKVLYDGNFMTKDLMAKVSNYTSYLSRRTHLKTVFGDVTHDGGIDTLIRGLHDEHADYRKPLDDRKSELQEKLKAEGITAADTKKIEGQIKEVDKALTKNAKQFDSAKKQMNHIFEKMMGTKRYSKGVEQARSIIMSLTAIANLPFVPFTQLNDLGAIGLQHGIWPFIRDGLVPMISSLNGLIKSKGSEAFRKTAGSIHLALQDVLNGYADRNWGSYSNPYLNLGRIAKGFEALAHSNSNFTLTNYIDNGLQRMSASVAQSEFMRILTAFKAGKMTKKEGIYLRKYGIDPERWGDRMLTAFKENGGGKTKLGGFQSLFHQWQDLEAANQFGNGVFRAVKDTQIQSGIADSPFWTDNPLGSIIKGFNGWMYASVNRYVIPSMQQPDAQKLLGVMLMVGLGSLVDPFRRYARGEEAYPDNLSDKQKLYAAISNSGYFSFFTTALQDANLLTNDRLLGNLKSDKYKDRARTGILGPSWGTANHIVDVLGAAGSGEWNKADMNKASRMMPYANASWTYWMSKQLTDSLDIPKNRTQAHALKENS